MNELIKMYIRGSSIQEIADRGISWEESDVLEILRSLKRKSENGRDYTQQFKELVVDRAMLGIYTKKEIVDELNISYRTINKYLKEFNCEIPTDAEEDEENMYQKIDWDSLTVCPECNSKRVNSVVDTKKTVFCIDCNTEWTNRDGVFYKLLWEYVS